MGLALLTTLLSHTSMGSAQTCASTQASWPNYPSWYGSSDVIYVYIKSDFASDMRGCSVNTYDDTELTQTKAELAIQSALEMWNQGSLGTALVYGGQTSASFATVCSSGSYEKPAVYVEFVAGCQNLDGDEECDGLNAGASVFDDAGCSNVVHLQVYGAYDTGSPTSCTTGEIPWSLGDTVYDGGTNDFKSILVHEFGHVLNLGHPTTDAIMKSGFGNYAHHRHLYGWDQDCADNNSTGRAIDHYARGRSTAGSWQSIVAVTTNTGKRGNYSGGFIQNSASTERYLWHFDSEVRYSPVGTDGLFSFSSSNSLTSALSNLLVSPMVGAAIEFSRASYKDNRINYVQSFSGGDVPSSRYARHNASTTGSFGTSITTGTYDACTSPACTSTSALGSHIPLSMAWDDYTQNTVFAQVSTARTSNAGKIFLYPGFYDAPGGDEDLLHYRQELISSKPSESYVLWDYSNRTDHPVGVACAPDQDDLDYNCLVVWNDRGVPDGSVLYQYFKVDTSGDDINFRPAASTKLTGAYAVGGVSAAWFDGKFWIAFKSGIDPFHDVYTAYTTSSTSYTSWSTPTSLGRFNIIDPPTWYYVPHQTHETALSWTEAHTQP